LAGDLYPIDLRANETQRIFECLGLLCCVQ
jgi:hypothetical protein